MGWRIHMRGQLGALSLALDFETSGSPTVIIGPNGAGKSTLLRALAGGSVPVQGSVYLGERCIMDYERGLFVAPENRRLGYVPQGSALFPHLSALENVAFGSAGRGKERTSDLHREARRALARFGAEHVARLYPAQLSGGEQQRVALARALVTEPEGLLLDEPLSAFDVQARRSARNFLRDHLQESQRPALVVTHDIRDVYALGGRVLVLEEGQIVQEGEASEIANAPATEFTAEFFGVDLDRSG